MIPIEDLRLLERLAREEMDRLDLEDARAALAEPGENIPLEVVKKELGLERDRRLPYGIEFRPAARRDLVKGPG